MELHFTYNSASKNYTAKDSDYNIIPNKPEIGAIPIDGQRELCSTLTGTANVPEELANDYVDLAGYLYALSLAGELPSDELISELVLCTSSVNQARANLSNGSMNVYTDIIKRPQLAIESEFSREIKIDGVRSNTLSSFYACSSFVSTGRCGEHSIHVSLIHSQKSKTDNTVHRISSEKLGHAWAESENCVMDSWAYGPAVLKKDAAYVAQEGDEKCIVSKEFGRKTLERGKALLADLENDYSIRQHLNDAIEHFTNINVSDVWPQTSILNSRLINLSESKPIIRPRTQQSVLNDEIIAVGVLRGLAKVINKSLIVKDAASASGMVLDAYKERFETYYLKQRKK